EGGTTGRGGGGGGGRAGVGREGWGEGGGPLPRSCPSSDVPVLSRHRSHAARLEPGRARVPSSFAYVAYPVYGAYEVDHPHRSHLEQPVTRPDNTARRALVAGAALIVGALTLTACGGSAQADGDRDGKGGRQSADVSGARIAISAKDGSTGASINSTSVKVSGGRLTDEKMTVADSGEAVSGSISPDGTAWKPGKQLERGTKYRIAATAKDREGRTAVADSSFTTVTSDGSFIGTYTPDNGTTVGVGMPVSFTFDKAITDKKAVQSHITVTSSSGQE